MFCKSGPWSSAATVACSENVRTSGCGGLAASSASAAVVSSCSGGDVVWLDVVLIVVRHIRPNGLRSCEVVRHTTQTSRHE